MYTITIVIDGVRVPFIRGTYNQTGKSDLEASTFASAHEAEEALDSLIAAGVITEDECSEADLSRAFAAKGI